MPDLHHYEMPDMFYGNRVEVVEACGEWFVRVVEHAQSDTRSFDLQALALAYADKERRRLKIREIVRI
jgi:hypothetical protein